MPRLFVVKSRFELLRYEYSIRVYDQYGGIKVQNQGFWEINLFQHCVLHDAVSCVKLETSHDEKV
jgi:hypothetical protein